MSSRTLGKLLGAWLDDPGLAATKVQGICIDSRRVTRGDAFFAYPGDTTDGRLYIEDAIARGASVVVCEDEAAPPVVAGAVPILRLQGLRDKVGIVAERFFDNPGQDLFIVGITGTNGKTSCAHLLTQALGAMGVRSGLIGTLGWGFLDGLEKNSLTTPDPVSLHRMLATLRDRGATHVCMEVSSHALVQGRVSGVSFDAALFTNLTHDHLDYHADIQQYARAKARLFECPTLRFAIVNRDDEFGRQLAGQIKAPTWTYGLGDADVSASDIVPDAAGLRLVLRTPSGAAGAHTRLVGRINVHNVLAVAAVLLADGHALSAVVEAVDLLQPVPGRMELFQRIGQAAASVVVDYAHTPDALERALYSVREHCAGQVWCVFGCGGDRDRAKRPVMGRIAERLADVTIVTDDNPRHEPPENITDEIVAGMRGKPLVINDRVNAIRWAIRHAGSEDWVLIAGKGHETTQQVGREFIDMDDRSIVNDCLGVAA